MPRRGPSDPSRSAERHGSTAGRSVPRRAQWGASRSPGRRLRPPPITRRSCGRASPFPRRGCPQRLPARQGCLSSIPRPRFPAKDACPRFPRSIPPERRPLSPVMVACPRPRPRRMRVHDRPRSPPCRPSWLPVQDHPQDHPRPPHVRRPAHKRGLSSTAPRPRDARNGCLSSNPSAPLSVARHGCRSMTAHDRARTKDACPRPPTASPGDHRRPLGRRRPHGARDHPRRADRRRGAHAPRGGAVARPPTARSAPRRLTHRDRGEPRVVTGVARPLPGRPRSRRLRGGIARSPRSPASTACYLLRGRSSRGGQQRRAGSAERRPSPWRLETGLAPPIVSGVARSRRPSSSSRLASCLPSWSPSRSCGGWDDVARAARHSRSSPLAGASCSRAGSCRSSSRDSTACRSAR